MNLLLSGGAIAGIIIGVVAFLLLVIVIWWISTSNKLKMLGIKVDESLSGIDVALQKRFDLLTKSLAVVKGYAKHESETLAKVIEMRNIGRNASIEETQEFANKTADALNRINIVAEQYPNLKADANFSKLQDQISDCEEQLQAARRVYNKNVTTFNTQIVVFPSSIVAKHMRLEAKKFFEAEEGKRQDVKMEF